jgi:CheY-like chemotaxis protein
LPRPAHRSALILEPSLITRQTLKRLLRRCGFERVLEADSAADAIMLLREQPVDLVLTPWAAPGMAGIPLLRTLRDRQPNRPGRGSPPAIILLDEGLPQQHVVAAVKAGVAGRLPVPAQAGPLSHILRTIAEPAPA